MDKNEVLKILETAKDKDDEIPMRLVRQAFEELPESCEDCVSRKDVLSEFCIHCDDGWNGCNCSVEKCYKAEWICNLPPAQSERKVSSRKGHWVKHDTGHSIYYDCSLCGCAAPCTETADKLLWKLSNYCPDCGSEMCNAEGWKDG